MPGTRYLQGVEFQRSFRPFAGLEHSPSPMPFLLQHTTNPDPGIRLPTISENGSIPEISERTRM